MTEEQRALAEALRTALIGANERLQGLDAETMRQLAALFDDAAADLVQAIRGRAQRDGVIPASELSSLLAEVGLLLGQLAGDQEQLLREAIDQSAQSGGRVADDLRSTADRVESLKEYLGAVPDAPAAAAEAVNTVWYTQMADGLVLSDRLWANYQGVRQAIEPVLTRSILEGETARLSARQAIAQGLQVDQNTLNRIELARAGALGEQTRSVLASDARKAYSAAERVFRTEIDRANIEASRATIYNVRGVVGTRVKLSPRHPRFDICDLHARANLYELGPGVYPPGRSPIPAHPNTLTREEAVFEWEITEADRQNPVTVFELLERQDESRQYDVLQSEDKVRELRAGRLKAEHILRPWRDIEDEYPDAA